MRIAIVGAGVAGLVSARVLRAVGVDVTVFEAKADLGGVWGPGRRYPGLATQDSKRTYVFSDHPMPADFPEYPTGKHVYEYLLSYVDKHGLHDCIELENRVERATPLSDGQGWSLDIVGPGGPRTESADWLIMANGLYSSPFVPDLPGRDAFERAGGVVLAPSEITDTETFRDRDVVVLGWGKSAADLAVASLGLARTTSLVVRQIAWKLPYRVGRLSFDQLILTRLGEIVMWRPRRRSLVATAVIRLLTPRKFLLRRLEKAVVDEWELERRALVPTGDLSGFTHLVTPGFFEAIDSGKIVVHRQQRVESLTVIGDRPHARLVDGQEIPADVVVAATGFDQDLSVLAPDARKQLLNGDGDMVLYRHVLPLNRPRLAFVGWSNSFRTPLTAELQALWVAANVFGLVRIPTRRGRFFRTVTYRLRHASVDARGLDQFTDGATIPDMDGWVAEAGLSIPLRVRLAQFVRPIDPSSYRGLLPQLQRRIADAVPAMDRARETAPFSDLATSSNPVGIGDDSTLR